VAPPGGGAKRNGSSSNSTASAGAAAAAAAAERRPKPVGVQSMGPRSVTQFVPNRVTIDVNASLCNQTAAKGNGKKPPPVQPARLHLRNARRDGGDAVFVVNATGNCTHLVFPVTPDGGVRSGSFAAKLSAPNGVTVALPGNITVVRPITVAAAAKSVAVAADGSQAQLRVKLSGPSKNTVRVRVKLSDGGLQVGWGMGASGPWEWERVCSEPAGGRVQLRLRQ
jgi:hypothetical protein